MIKHLKKCNPAMFSLVLNSVLMSSLMLASSARANTQANVNIQINQQTFHYSIPAKQRVTTDNNANTSKHINNSRSGKGLGPRLADVLAPVALEKKWYWPASALYQLDDNKGQLLQQKVLVQIHNLQQEVTADSKLYLALASMAEQIKNWQVATRIVIPIDYDGARIKAEFNPSFPAGDYQLKLVTRPTDLTVFGLVAKPSQLSFSAATNVAKFSDELKLLAAADSNTLYVVQPNGDIIKASTAAWQEQWVEAMPGAQIFVPFQPSLFSAKWQQLNQNILELARHRVLL